MFGSSSLFIARSLIRCIAVFTVVDWFEVKSVSDAMRLTCKAANKMCCWLVLYQAVESSIMILNKFCSNIRCSVNYDWFAKTFFILTNFLREWCNLLNDLSCRRLRTWERLHAKISREIFAILYTRLNRQIDEEREYTPLMRKAKKESKNVHFSHIMLFPIISRCLFDLVFYAWMFDDEMIQLYYFHKIEQSYVHFASGYKDKNCFGICISRLQWMKFWYKRRSNFHSNYQISYNFQRLKSEIHSLKFKI